MNQKLSCGMRVGSLEDLVFKNARHKHKAQTAANWEQALSLLANIFPELNPPRPGAAQPKEDSETKTGQ